MKLIWWLLQLTTITSALPGNNQPGREVKLSTPLAPSVTNTQSIPFSAQHGQVLQEVGAHIIKDGAVDGGSDERKKGKSSRPQHKQHALAGSRPKLTPIPTMTRMSKLRPTPTVTAPADGKMKGKSCRSKHKHNEYCRDCAPPQPATSPACGYSGNPAVPHAICTCTNSFTTTLSLLGSTGKCPTEIPSHWTTTTPPQSMAISTSDIPFSYYNVSNGALVHCESSVVSVLNVWTTPLTETYCAGSTSTDSNSMGVASTTSLYPLSLSPVMDGNWGYYTMSVTSGSGAWDATSASYDLMVKFYTAFSNACTSSFVSTVTTTTTLSLYTFSNLPGGGKGSVTKTSEPVTYYACDSTPVSVAPWIVQDSESVSDLDPSGTLYAKLSYSRFSPDNLDAWLWMLAFRFAHATVNSLSYESITREEGRAMMSIDYPFFTVPRSVELEYSDDMNEVLEKMTVQMTWEDDSSNSLLCEVLVDLAIALISLVEPEADELLATMDIEISQSTKDIISRGAKRGLRMGCAGQSENSYA